MSQNLQRWGTCLQPAWRWEEWKLYPALIQRLQRALAPGCPPPEGPGWSPTDGREIKSCLLPQSGSNCFPRFKTTTLPALTNVPNSFLILRCQRSSIVSKGKRGRRRGREASMGERNTDGLPFVGTPTGNRTHKACALTRNRTHSL